MTTELVKQFRKMAMALNEFQIHLKKMEVFTKKAVESGDQLRITIDELVKQMKGENNGSESSTDEND